MFRDPATRDLSLGRIAGVRVGISWGLLAIAALFAVTLAAAQYPRSFPGHWAGTYWLVGITATLLFIGSVLVHELGHALVARSESVPVEGITLWMFGGYARLGALPPTAASEARIAAAGPAATALAAGVFWLSAVFVQPAGQASMVATMFEWLAVVNLVLLGLNLLPALPLDGGRIVGALVWAVTGRRHTGMLAAARAGWLVGGALLAGGLWFAAQGRPEGVWGLLIGWITVLASADEERHQRIARRWVGRTAVQAMSPHPPVADEWMTLESFATNLAARPDDPHVLFPVRGVDGRTVGGLRREVLAAVPPLHRRRVKVSEVAEPLRDVPIVHPDTALTDLTANHPEVFDTGVFVAGPDGRVCGVVGPGELVRVGRRPSRPAR